MSLFVLLLCISCTQTIDKQFLIGSWTAIEDPDHVSLDYSERLTFLPGNKGLLEFIKDDQVVSADSFLYYVEEKTNYLITEYNKNVFKTEIIDLDKQKLLLQQESTKSTLRYKRITSQ